MTNKASTRCVLCGKQRILSSTTEEVVGTSKIVTTEAICPDPKCQKKVAEMLKKEHDRRVLSELQRQERMSGRKNRHDLK